MKKIITLISAFLLVVSVTAVAQPKAGTFSIIPRLGVTLATLTGETVYLETGDGNAPAGSRNYKPGLMAGLDVEYQITDILAVSAGAYYSQQGTKYDDVDEYHDITTKNWREVRKWKEHYDYVNIPVMLSAYVYKNLALKVGAQLGINTNGKMEYTNIPFSRTQSGEIQRGNLYKVENDILLKKMEFSIPVGISYEYMNVILDARYNIGLTNVNKYGGSTNRNSVFTVNVGYRFSL